MESKNVSERITCDSVNSRVITLFWDNKERTSRLTREDISLYEKLMEVHNGNHSGTPDLGETIIEPTEDFIFKFSYNLHGSTNILTVDVPIPLKKTVQEFANRLIASHPIPCYLHEGKNSNHPGPASNYMFKFNNRNTRTRCF